MTSLLWGASALGRLPLLVRAGLLAFGIGTAGDVAHHALPASLVSPLEPLLGSGGANAHAGILLGMVLILLTVMQRGLRSES